MKNNKVTTVRMSEEDHAKIVEFCVRRKISMNKFMRAAVLRAIEREFVIGQEKLEGKP